MYPTVVMVLVESQRPMTEITRSLPNTHRLAGPVATEARAANLGHPLFSVLNIMIDNEAESWPSHTAEPGCTACAGTWFGEGHSEVDLTG